MSSNPLVPSFRYGTAIPPGAAHETVIQALRDHDKGITDLETAIPILAAKINKLTAAKTTSTTTTVEQTTEAVISSSIGAVNNQSGVTSYTTAKSDYGALVILNDASPIAVSLLSSFPIPWFTTMANQGTGLATLTPTTGTINTLVSLSLPPSSFTNVYFDGSNWWTSVPPVIFTRGGTILNPNAAINVVVWYAPFAATVTNVLGYVGGVAGSVINAQRNGSLPLLVTNLTLSTAGSWTDGGAVQNTAIAVGDKIEMMVISVAGAPSEIAVEIQCTRP